MATKKTASKSKTATKELKCDKWGFRAGTQVTRINAVITKKPLTVKQIAQKAKAHLGATRQHIRTLRDKKLIVIKDGMIKAK